MIIFKKADDIKDYLHKQRANGLKIGFVPTMGALHFGHISLVEKAKNDGNLVVSSIFVNPTQFNNKEDFEKYPTSPDADIAMLTDAGCDVLLLPSVDEMYPGGTEKTQSYNFGYLETVLEGAQRPGHFKGVGQIVSRLLHIVGPQHLYMGQKDYQQCMVIGDLLRQTGMNKDVQLHIMPTLREDDGLAMSSRNRRLTEPQRITAAVIYQCLVSIQGKADGGNFAIARKESEDLLKDKGFEPEYVALANADTLELMDDYKAGTPMVALIAARLGNVRLIDNLLLN